MPVNSANVSRAPSPNTAFAPEARTSYAVRTPVPPNVALSASITAAQSDLPTIAGLFSLTSYPSCIGPVALSGTALGPRVTPLSLKASTVNQ